MVELGTYLCLSDWGNRTQRQGNVVWHPLNKLVGVFSLNVCDGLLEECRLVLAVMGNSSYQNLTSA